MRAGALARDPSGPICRQFLQRVFAVQAVDSVEIDGSRDLIQIEYDSPHGRTRVLQDLADVFRATGAGSSEHVRHLCLVGAVDRAIRVTRYDETLSTWDVLHRIPGRIRLRHAALATSASALLAIQSGLAALDGVSRAVANRRTGTILVEFDEQILSTADMLLHAEGISRELLEPATPHDGHGVAGMIVPSGGLALAVAADFFVPALMPASAALLVATNIRNLLEALRELRQLRPGMATLYTAIVGCTLASGYFFPAALMSWLMNFWDRRHHRSLAAARQELKRTYRLPPRTAWRQSEDGGDVETPVENLNAGDIVTVRFGERIPVDGAVVSGEATLVEWPANSLSDTRTVAAGCLVRAGSRLLRGAVRVSVERAGSNTRASSIATLLDQATTSPPVLLKHQGAAIARRAVPATLALAGLGLATGDVGATLAVLRPDYATGAGMSTTVGTFHDVTTALRGGIVVRDPRILTDLAEIDVLMLGVSASSPVAHDAWHEQLIDLRGHTDARIGLVSEMPMSELRTMRDRLGCDFALGDLSDPTMAEFLDNCQRDGRKVAFIGDCGRHPAAARQANVAISLGDVASHASDPAQAFLLEPSPGLLGKLWELARDRRRRNRLLTACTVAPNVACVVGAFALGFTGLHAVVLSNLGVYATYQTTRRWLGASLHGTRG